MPAKDKFQFDTLYELSFTIFDISPKVALYGPTRKDETAPANMATLNICGEMPIPSGFRPSVINARETAG